MSETKVLVKLLMKLLDEKRKHLINFENIYQKELNAHYDPEGKLTITAQEWFGKSADPTGDRKALNVIEAHEKRELLDDIYYNILDDLLEGE